nr:phosphoenolpyruvate carboxykinase [uncultured Anaerostipes sp.]
MESVLQTEKVCYVCGTEQDLHCHHIFEGTANRRKSEEHGMKIWLCARHHNMSNSGIHFNPDLENEVKKTAQRYFERHIGDREAFRREFGKSWL